MVLLEPAQSSAVPEGATHILPAYENALDCRPSYLKWGYDFTGPESGKMFCCWFFWSKGAWHKDTSFVERHNRLVKL